MLAATGASYEILAELEHLSGSPEAADHMLQAAALEPTANRWLRAAQFLDDPLRKFAALRNGLSLEPSNPRLNVELATYYIGRQQLEKARDVLAAAAEAAPNDFVIRERRASLFLNLGLRSKALPELRRLEKAVAFALYGCGRGWRWTTNRWDFWMMPRGWQLPWWQKQQKIASR